MVRIFEASKKDASLEVARLIAEEVKIGNLLLGTSTGRSPEKIYADMQGFQWTGKEKIEVFQQDVYVGQNLKGKIGLDYVTEIKNSLINPCFPHINFFFPDGAADDPETAAKIHSEHFWKVREGKKYIHLLGIGVNGHIGFNEPGTSFDSATHVVNLTESTIQRNADLYFDGDTSKVPKQAITTGLGELSSMDNAIMVAFGDAKANALYNAFVKEPSTQCPASVLMAKNVNTILFADAEALAKIKASSKYEIETLKD